MKRTLTAIGLIILFLAAGAGAIYFVKTSKPKATAKTVTSKDKYAAFELEIWDTIKTNYWDKVSDEALSNIYLLAVNKESGKTYSLTGKDKNGVETLLNAALKEVSADKKEDFSATVADMVLANLSPFGRSRLYAEKDTQQLSNVVNNVNPGSNYFQDLGVNTSATDKQVAQAFDQKAKELAPLAKTSTAAAQKLAEVQQADKVLKNSDSRSIYAVSGVEPTIDYKLMTPSIFYMHLTKFSPTSLDEFARVTAKVDKGTTLDTLILDLRDNIGGAIDYLPYFLGPFIGPNTYAYQFYQQGNTQDFKTLTGWMNSLVRYKKVVILINQNTQSSAEVMAASLKKYNVGVLIGTNSKGWGTVERVFPLTNQLSDDSKYSVYLVHHVTLRDDGLPIEGRGVEPNILITDPNWKKELLQRYNFPEMVKAVEDIYAGK